MTDDLYTQVLRTALAAGIPIISTDTSARIMAVIHIHGENEAFVFSPKLKADLIYICQRFGIYGTGTPDPDFARLVKQYSDELLQYEHEHKHEEASLGSPKPQWAHDLFKSRYGIKLIN